jgi:integrase
VTGPTPKASLSQVRGETHLKGTKTNRSRKVPLSSLAVEALRSHRAIQAQQKLMLGTAYRDQSLVFATVTGDSWLPATVTDKFRKLARRCGVSSTRLHDARHTAATWLITEGVDISTVGGILGHAAASTTLNIYSHVVAGVAEAAVEKIDLHLARGRLKTGS